MADAVSLVWAVLIVMTVALVVTLVCFGCTVAGHRKDQHETSHQCLVLARLALEKGPNEDLIEQLDRTHALLGSKFDQAMDAAMACSGDWQEMTRKRSELTFLEVRQRELAEQAKRPGAPAAAPKTGDAIEATQFSDTL